MRKLYGLLVLSLFAITLVGCQKSNASVTADNELDNTYLLLIEAEDLSGMSSKTKTTITEDGSLGLPTSYKGVSITYESRNKEIISDSGVVTRPNTCWIESRDQQGQVNEEFIGLNDNWPVVIDVVLSLNGQTRRAKLLFVVAPREGFTCSNYKG